MSPNPIPSCALCIVALVPHTGCTCEALFRVTHAQVRLSGCCLGRESILNFQAALMLDAGINKLTLLTLSPHKCLHW